MNILCVIDSLGSGGAQRQMVELAKGFKSKGNNVSFMVYHEENFFKDLLDYENIPVTIITEKNYLNRLLKMRRLIRHGNFDGVVSFLEAANFICEFAGLPWRQWKLIVGERSANPSILSSFKRKLYRWFHLFADYVVANSEENLSMVRKINPLLSKRKCKVIYNIVDLDLWHPVKSFSAFKDEKLNIVVAASHQYLKNAAGLIAAIHKLPDPDKNRLKIDWYGDESPDHSFIDAKALVEKYSLESVFNFHPATKDIAEKMNAADVIGLFSLYEGLPNVICEAMSLGKFVIASSVSDIPYILNSENEQWLFNPNNVDDIAKTLSALLKLTELDIVKIGKYNRIRALALFDKQQVLSEYIKLLN